jgi:uncharacterized protein (TIGR03437 family)
MPTTRVLVLCLAIGLAPVHRLSAQQTAAPFGAVPARIVGQASLDSVQYSTSPNLVEGKEFWSPAGIALDKSLSQPGLYVSDTLNNRVLGWRNAASFANGAPADIVVGQPAGPFALATTNAEGPCAACNRQQTRGLHWPTGLAVDGQGNLYVIDAGNNRILRYPQPFALPDKRMDPDVLIGQPDFNSYLANHGGTTPAADGISPLVSGFPISQGLAFDANGNLWFADTNNNRVLRFPKGADGKVQGTADIVLGQQNMTSNVAAAVFTNLGGLRYPYGLTIDAAGRTYVSDGLGRVLIYQSNPQSTGNPAMKILGLVVVPQGQQPPAAPNATQFGAPLGLVMMGNSLAVIDAGYNRIMVFDPLDAWLADPSTGGSSPAARSVIGQADFSGSAASAAANGLGSPTQAAFSGTELFVADSANNRVVVFPQGVTTATRELGQRDFGYSAINWIEGRELYLGDSGGMVVDTTSDPPHLYISDPYNNRVLGYRDARNVRPGDTATLVIGQPDGFSSGINGEVNDANRPSSTRLYVPAGVAVDANGNLYVADRGNGRVLRFPRPFDQPNLSLQTANLVLGQSDFTSPRDSSVNRIKMSAPYGLAFMQLEGHLLVSDMQDNRVLLFKKPQGGDFSNAQPADGVIGQGNFTDASTAQGLPDKMVFPRGIATDTSGRLYVADIGNNRILVYGGVASYGPSGGPPPVLAITNSCWASTSPCTPVGLNSPMGVAVNPANGEIWVAETMGVTGTIQSGRILRYAEFVTTSLTGLPDFILPTVTNPLAVALDGFGNLLVGEAGNRVSFYFPPLWVTSSGNYLPDAKTLNTYSQPCCAPGALATAWPFSPANSFGAITGAHAPSLPLTTTLSDVQLLVDGAPAPLLDVYSSQVNFQVPKDTNSSAAVSVVLMRASAGQVLATGTAVTSAGAPALLQNPSFRAGVDRAVQVVAQNNGDSPVSCNGVAGTTADPGYCPGGVRPANRGEVITLYALGQGLVDGMPADGAGASGQPTLVKPRVFIGTQFVADADVQFSGLAPTLVGVWQINVKVPSSVAPGPVWIMLWYSDKYSSVPSSPPNASYPSNPFTVIQVK